MSLEQELKVSGKATSGTTRMVTRPAFQFLTKLFATLDNGLECLLKSKESLLRLYQWFTPSRTILKEQSQNPAPTVLEMRNGTKGGGYMHGKSHFLTSWPKLLDKDNLRDLRFTCSILVDDNIFLSFSAMNSTCRLLIQMKSQDTAAVTKAFVGYRLSRHLRNSDISALLGH